MIGPFVGFREHAEGSSTPNALPLAHGQATEDLEKKAAYDKSVLAKELPPYVPDFTKAFEWIWSASPLGLRVKVKG